MAKSAEDDEVQDIPVKFGHFCHFVTFPLFFQNIFKIVIAVTEVTEMTETFEALRFLTLHSLCQDLAAHSLVATLPPPTAPDADHVPPAEAGFL